MMSVVENQSSVVKNTPEQQNLNEAYTPAVLKTNNNSNKIILILSTISIVIVILGVALFWLQKQFRSPLEMPNSNSVESPLDYNDTNILSAALTYTVRGKIENISDQGGNKTLKIDTPVKNLPPIIIEPDTIISELQVEPFSEGFNGNRLSRIEVHKLQKGKEVSVELMWGIRANRWFVRNVILVPNSTN